MPEMKAQPVAWHHSIANSLLSPLIFKMTLPTGALFSRLLPGTAFCGRSLKEPMGRTGLPVVLSAVALAKEEAFLTSIASAT